MTCIALKHSLVSIGILLLSGCASTEFLDKYATNDAGFANVSSEVKKTTGKQTAWVQNNEQARAISKRVHALTHRKTINADTAVQVALLNNKGLQAAYAEIGLSAAEVWQENLPENPRARIEILGIAAPELGLARSVEGWVANNILRLLTRKHRVDLADTRFRQAQKRAILETLQLAGQTRIAWINAVAAFENVVYLNQAQIAADAASELAEQLGKSGALTKARQAREHVFYSELTGQKAEAKLAAKMAKGELTKLMGLYGQEANYFVPDFLPDLPSRRRQLASIEAQALKKRVDIQIAKLELEALAKSYGFTKATRYVTDFEIVAGLEVERERGEEGGIETTTTPQVELEFVIPIFDTGKPRLRRAELSYLRAANQLAELAINVRNDAKGAYEAYNARYDIARHYKRNVIPLRTKIEEEALLTYNGMITNTFELLQDTRAKTEAILLSVTAKRNFWLADTNLTGAMLAGGDGAPASDQSVSVASGGSAEH